MCKLKYFLEGEGLSIWSCKGTKWGEKGRSCVNNVYMIITLFWYSICGKVQDVICTRHLIRRIRGVIMNISLVSASNCTELSLAVDLKNRLLESSLPFYIHWNSRSTPPAHSLMYTYIHTHIYTYILYVHIHTHTHTSHNSASCSVRRDIFKKGKTRVASFQCAFCLYSE